MNNLKKRDRDCTEKVSPPHKMTKNATNQPSNSDLMDQLNQIVASNADVIKKIDQLEKRFDKVEKLFEEVDELKKRLSLMSKPMESFKRFEVEQKKKSVLIKGLDTISTKRYETRAETHKRVSDLFDHLGLNLTVEDYQRLGPIKPDDAGSTLVRLQFWSKDDKSLIFSKFKEYSDDEVVKKLSLINDYPLFQLADVKRLSDESYKLRQKNKSIKTRIVPRGLEVQLQTRDPSGKWTTVSNKPPQSEA
jgi:vacuolar-type H+-ATPase subunit I/STV1